MCMKKCIIGGIVAGVVLFIWSAVSWMLLPWHMTTINKFEDITAVSQIIKANAPKSGVYVMPMSDQALQSNQLTDQVPYVFATVRMESIPESMTSQFIMTVIAQIIAAFLVAWMLCKTSGLSFFGRVGFVVIFAIAASFAIDIPNWIWFRVDSSFTLLGMIDMLVGWFLAGLVLAGICNERA